MPDFEKFLKGISQGVRKFYEPITDRVKDANERRAQEGKPKSIKSNVPGDLDVTYDESKPLKDQVAINPHPLQTNAEGKIEMKPNYFTENSTILNEHVVDSSDQKTSKYNELRNNMAPPKGKPNSTAPNANKQTLERKDLKANQQQVDKMNNNKDVVTNYSEEDNSLQNLENKF